MRLVDYFKRLLSNRFPAYFNYATIDENETLESRDLELGISSHTTTQASVSVEFTSDDLAQDSLASNPLHAQNQTIETNANELPPTTESLPSDTISGYQTLSLLLALIFERDNLPNIGGAFLLTLLGTALNFTPPILLGETIQSLNQTNDTINVANHELSLATWQTILIGLLVGSFILSKLVPNWRDQVLTPVAANNSKKIVDRFTTHQLQKSLYYHSTTSFSQQIYLFQKGFATASVIPPLLTQIAPTFIELLFAVTALSARYDASIGVVIASMLAVYVAYAKATTQVIIDSREMALRSGNKEFETVEPALKRYKNIHDFGKYHQTLAGVKLATTNNARVNTTATLIALKVGMGNIIIPGLAMLAASLIMATKIREKRYTAQDFIVLFGYLSQLVSIIPNFGQALTLLFSAYPDIKFIFTELVKPAEIIDLYPNTPLVIDGPPSIRFDNVHYTHPPKGCALLLMSESPIDKKIPLTKPTYILSSDALYYIFDVTKVVSDEHRINILPDQGTMKDLWQALSDNTVPANKECTALTRTQQNTITMKTAHTQPILPPVFKGLSFTIEPGQKVALVSRSGGGKSTLFNLLYRYYSPASGTIYINDQDIAKVSLKSTQDHIGLMGQAANLFNGTVRDNILYGAADGRHVSDTIIHALANGSADASQITDEEIYALAKSVNLDSFIKNLSAGLDTQVGEEGKELSGGEQYKVAILRGLMKQAPIRLLDEITGALDSLSATQILTGMDTSLQNTTRIMITHKLLEAQDADVIIVLEQGVAIAQGTHAELLNDCPLYQDLWNEQNNASPNASGSNSPLPPGSVQTATLGSMTPLVISGISIELPELNPDSGAKCKILAGILSAIIL